MVEETIVGGLGAPGTQQAAETGDLCPALSKSLGGPTFVNGSSDTIGGVLGALLSTLDLVSVGIVDLVSFRRKGETGDNSATATGEHRGEPPWSVVDTAGTMAGDCGGALPGS